MRDLPQEQTRLGDLFLQAMDLITPVACPPSLLLLTPTLSGLSYIIHHVCTFSVISDSIRHS